MIERIIQSISAKREGEKERQAQIIKKQRNIKKTGRERLITLAGNSLGRCSHKHRCTIIQFFLKTKSNTHLHIQNQLKRHKLKTGKEVKLAQNERKMNEGKKGFKTNICK